MGERLFIYSFIIQFIHLFVFVAEHLSEIVPLLCSVLWQRRPWPGNSGSDVIHHPVVLISRGYYEYPFYPPIV